MPEQIDTFTCARCGGLNTTGKLGVSICNPCWNLATEPSYETILDEAKALVYGDRNDDYGDCVENWTITAAFWSLILGIEVPPHKAALCMDAAKTARALVSPLKRDNYADKAGYSDIAYRVAQATLATERLEHERQ